MRLLRCKFIQLRLPRLASLGPRRIVGHASAAFCLVFLFQRLVAYAIFGGQTPGPILDSQYCDMHRSVEQVNERSAIVHSVVDDGISNLSLTLRICGYRPCKPSRWGMIASKDFDDITDNSRADFVLALCW